MEDDRARPDEADAAHDLRRYTAGIEPYARPGQNLGKAVLGDDHNQSAAERNEEMGAETRILDPVLAVEPDHGAECTGYEQSQNEIPRHNIRFLQI